MRRLRIIVAALLLSGGAGAYLYHAVSEPYAGFETKTIVQIERGQDARQMARLLEGRGVVRSRWRFLLVRLLRPRAILQAGEYGFDRPASAWEVFDRIVRGDVYYYAVTVPEGSTIFDTARILARLDWISQEEALAAVRDPELIRDLAPGAETLEGFLFPSTYFVTRNASAREICQMMTARFRQVWRELGDGPEAEKTVTLASLVEKETAVPEERPLVASVYSNRLKRGIRLECDPTVIYAAILEGRYQGVIRQSDLASPNPYNTYQHAGLPPGPIASPGRASLEAALRPARTDYLFFVAKPGGSGAHVFSRTLAAHNRAVGRYRREKRKANGQ